MKFIATTFFGLEQSLAEEIVQWGGTHVSTLNRAVSFKGDLKTLYSINLWSRTALRVLRPILEFKAHNETVLYQRVKRFDWTKIIKSHETFVINATVHSEHFKHSQYVIYKVKDAIVDRIRSSSNGRRPSIDSKDPDVTIRVHCQQKNFSISLDSSGDSLHKRGYRERGGEAPLNEALAAGMILLSGWNHHEPLYDPMCGTGTVLAEAGLIAKNVPPRYKWDQFGFMKWRDYDPTIWNEVKSESLELKNDASYEIYGNDKLRKSVWMTQMTLQKLNLSDIKLSTSDFFDSPSPSDEGVIITNPPYGLRLGSEEMGPFYRQIGDTLKQYYDGWRAWILSGNIPAIKKLGLRTSKKLSLYNGSVPCKYHLYEMYKGTKKRGESAKES